MGGGNRREFLASELLVAVKLRAVGAKSNSLWQGKEEKPASLAASQTRLMRTISSGFKRR
jgi:hypothetical protein